MNDAPHLSTQMPWWAALILFLVLPLSIGLLSLFVRRYPPRVIASLSHIGARFGLGFAVLFVLVGFLTTGEALIGLFRYKEIDAEGITITNFLHPQERQRWDELEAVRFEGEADSELPQTMTSPGLPTAFLEFREAGRWRVSMRITESDFGPDAWHEFALWLKRGTIGSGWQLDANEINFANPVAIPLRSASAPPKPPSEVTKKFIADPP